MGLLSEFKTFAIRGNVVDLAVAVIIGGAFGQIVGSLVADVITPMILKPALDATGLKNIEELATQGGVRYGKFISTIINFIVVTFCLFIVVKGINAAKKKEAAAAPAAPPADVQLLTEIRDLLKK